MKYQYIPPPLQGMKEKDRKRRKGNGEGKEGEEIDRNQISLSLLIKCQANTPF